MLYGNSLLRCGVTHGGEALASYRWSRIMAEVSHSLYELLSGVLQPRGPPLPTFPPPPLLLASRGLPTSEQELDLSAARALAAAADTTLFPGGTATALYARGCGTGSQAHLSGLCRLLYRFLLGCEGGKDDDDRAARRQQRWEACWELSAVLEGRASHDVSSAAVLLIAALHEQEAVAGPARGGGSISGFELPSSSDDHADGLVGAGASALPRQQQQ